MENYFETTSEAACGAVCEGDAETAVRHGEILQAILSLPKKYRLILHLYYYEDYDTKEIAGLLHMNEATVRTRLARGRKILKEVLADV